MVHQRAAAKGVPPEAPISKLSETVCPCRTKETTEFGAVVAGNAVTAGYGIASLLCEGDGSACHAAADIQQNVHGGIKTRLFG